MDFVSQLLVVVMAACLGGVVSKFLKIPSLVGYIIFGILTGFFLPGGHESAQSLAEVGTILLLFSIGIELSLEKVSKFFSVGVFGGLLQMVLVTIVSAFVLRAFGVELLPSFILGLGFSLSSTAVVVKILNDKGESDTIHGGLMIALLLVQDLAVIPIMVVLPLLSSGVGPGFLMTIGIMMLKTIAIVIGTLVLGKLIAPKVVHLAAAANSREVLLLTSVALALGTAVTTSLLGISAALGAFLAGMVISESQEHHAVFAETRPLRDLFVAVFFVTLGFLVNVPLLLGQLPLVLMLTAAVMLLKAVVVFFVSTVFGYKGRTGISSGLGLAQIGEFAFVIFSASFALKLISFEVLNLGIGVTLLSLIVSPLLFNLILPTWRRLRDLSGGTLLYKLFSSVEKKSENSDHLTDHIIVCGYGRVGRWVGKALADFKIPFIVIDYNQKVVSQLRKEGISVLYGDPTEPELLEAADIRSAKAIILAIPDRVAQESLVAYTQSVAPEVKIISRVHLDEDWEKLKLLRVDKIVQPEFEAAVEIVRSILTHRGKTKDEVSEFVKGLRMSHSVSK